VATGFSSGSDVPLRTERLAELLVRCTWRGRNGLCCGYKSLIRLGMVISICQGHLSHSPSIHGNHELVDPGSVSLVV